MTDIVHLRSIVPVEPLHLRDEGRSVFGMIVPWNTRSSVTEPDDDGQLVTYDEMFLPGSFERMSQIARKRSNWGWIALNLDHDRGLDSRIGYATEVEQNDLGAYATFKLYDGPQLPKVRSMLEESHDGLSIEFRDMARPRVADDGLVQRTQVFVTHVAATPVPTYATAGVLAMRSSEYDMSTPLLDETRAWLASLERDTSNT